MMSQIGQEPHEEPVWRIGTNSFELISTIEWEPHSHDDQHELLWGARGALTAETDHGYFAIPGSLGLWIPAGVTHRVVAAAGTAFRCSFIAGELDTVSSTTTAVAMPAVVRALLDRLEAAPYLSTQPRVHAEELVLDLLEPVEVATVDLPFPSDTRTRRIAEALLADPSDPRSIDDWGRHVGSSGRNLSRLSSGWLPTTLSPASAGVPDTPHRALSCRRSGASWAELPASSLLPVRTPTGSRPERDIVWPLSDIARQHNRLAMPNLSWHSRSILSGRRPMRSKHLSFVALAATGLLLTACGSSAATGGSASDTVELTTPTGAEITMPAEPQAALGFYTTDVDLLITLGFDLAGTQPIRDDFSTFPDFFPQEELEGLETFGNFPEFNLEAVLGAEPDFILNDLGREDEWQAWVDQYEARVADIRERLDEADIDPVVADIGYYEGQVTTSCYGVPCLVFADLGLRMDPLMNATDEGLPASDEYTELSGEQVGQLSGIDIAFTSADENGDIWVETDEALQQNELWQNLPFVANSEYYGYNYEMAYGSPSGQDAFLTVVEEALLG
jgi:iron complex transport system substrate-binding protein